MRRSSRRPRLALTVQRAVEAGWVPNDSELRRWAARALMEDAEVTLRLIGQKEARTLNRAFRRRDYATNVLAFAYTDQQPLAGDITICIPVVEREAHAQGKTRKAHLAHLVVHGMLHLQGFVHERRLEAELMEGIESELVIKLGYPDPYEPRMKAEG
jgi:probable rRNA maturation factor